MKAKVYNQILQQMNDLSVNTEDCSSVLLCYILAQLNIKYSGNCETLNGINSSCFYQSATDFGFSSPLPDYIHNELFSIFCNTLLHNNLHSDCHVFFDYFTPRLISQRDTFTSLTSNLSVLEISVVLCRILMETNSIHLRFDEINHKSIKEIYQKLLPTISCYISNEQTFTQLWESIYFIPMPKLKVSFSRKLIETIKYYRKYKVSGLTLLENYCQYNKYKTQLDDALNPWSDFERVIKNSPAPSGVTIAETAFNLIRSISRENPTDIVRAAIYPHPEFFSKASGIIVKPQNDGRFECSFLLHEFEKLVKQSSNILIVNPGPDFLLRWNDLSGKINYNCTVAVANKYFSSAYRMQFPNFKFCLYSDLDNNQSLFDLVAIISTSGSDLNIESIMSQCCDGGRIIALLPQAFFTRKNDIGRIFSSRSTCVEKIISIAPEATVSKPSKKMILFARNTAFVPKTVPIFFTQCDEKSDNMIIEKNFIRVSYGQLYKGYTLNQLRISVEREKQELLQKANRRKALVYSFSDEIKLRYTIHLDKHNSYVGEVYYRALSRQDKKKKSEWDSGVTQKGLRNKNRETVIANLESTAYYDNLSHCITGDILQFYEGQLATCSLKTIWFCCRTFLLLNSSYNDDSAQTILFSSLNPALSSIYPKSATDDDYRNAMESVIPTDSKAVVKYWDQLNLIMRAAVSLGYLPKNPISSLLPEISKKASKELINLRNALTKKTFTVEEEHRIFTYLCEETNIDFGPRKAKRYEAESIWLLGALRLFAGLSIREACALTWGDYAKVDSLKAYQLSIFKFLRDDGSCAFILDEVSTKYSYRKIPVAPVLSDMLNSRLTYMRAVLGYTDSEIKSTPIVLGSERSATSKAKCSHCKYSNASKICRQIIEAADIPTQELILPGTDGIIVDMNKYMGDIFYSNFRHRANHICNFTRGELSYMLGNKAPDTFSQHYCDYSSDLIQYAIVQKLRRWTFKYENPSHFSPAVSVSKNHAGNFSISTETRNGHTYNCLDISLTANETIPGSYIDINIESEHGITGTATVYPKGE